MITSPLKRFDCALVSDGAAAAIVTSADRARDLKQKPVRLMGLTLSSLEGEEPPPSPPDGQLSLL